MLAKKPTDLTAPDLHSLVDNKVPEGRTLDFKIDYGREDGRKRAMNDEAKRELLADVTAFANTLGGDLVFGVDEVAGEASSVVGLDLEDPDAEILKLEGIIRDGIEPRLPGVSAHAIKLDDGRSVIVIRTPRSWIGPHKVIANRKFWARNSKGKYEMDVTELRQSFIAADSAFDRIRKFRAERLALISADEGMVPIKSGAKLVIHIVPLSAFTSPVQLTFDSRTDAGIRPPGASGWNPRHTFEGFGSYSGPEEQAGPCRAYGLLFRNGIVEAVAGIDYNKDKQKPGLIPGDFEDHIVRDVPAYLKRLQKERIEGPFYLLTSLLGVRNHVLWTRFREWDPMRALRRDNYLFPELELKDANVSDKDLMPLCDLFFNAFGYECSSSFTKEGEYKGTRN